MGHLEMNLSRNGLIVLVSIIFVAGAGTAYAGMVLPMITLAGDVTITGDMTCPGCVDSADIADGTITSVDIAPGTLAVTRRADTQTMSPGTLVFFTVPCLSGEQPTGGGWLFLGPDKTKAGILDSNPSSNGWFVQSRLDSSASGDVSVTGYVECIRLQ